MKKSYLLFILCVFAPSIFAETYSCAIDMTRIMKAFNESFEKTYGFKSKSNETANIKMETIYVSGNKAVTISKDAFGTEEKVTYKIVQNNKNGLILSNIRNEEKFVAIRNIVIKLPELNYSVSSLSAAVDDLHGIGGSVGLYGKCSIIK